MNEKIKSVDLLHMSNARHFQFVSDFKHFVDSSDEKVKTLLTPYMSVFDTLVAQEDELFKTIQKSELTERIKNADRERDGLYVAIHHALDALTYDETPKISDNAKHALAAMDNYGSGVPRKTYSEETAIITNLIQDFAKALPLYVDALVEKLAEVNGLVDSLLLQRDADKAEITMVEKLRDVRRSIDTLIHAMINAVNAMAVIDPESYALFIAEINTLIDRYRRRKRSSKTGDEDGEDEDEGEEEGGGEEEIDVIEEVKIKKKTE